MTKQKPSQKDKKWFLLTSALVLTPALVFLLILIYSSYANFYLPLIPLSWQSSADSFLASLPINAKSSRQVLAKTIGETKNLTSYEIDATLSLKQGSNQLSLLRLVGDIAKAGNLDSQYQAGLYVQESSTLSASFVEDIDDFYIKVNRNLVLPGWVLPATGQNWLQIKLSDLEKKLNVKTRNDQKIILDVNSRLGKEEFLARLNNLHPVLTKATFEGGEVYRTKVSLNQEFLKDIFGQQADFENPQLVIDSGAKDFKIRQVSFSGRVKLLPGEQSTNLNVIYKLGKSSGKFNLPNPTEVISAPLDLWLKFNSPQDASLTTSTTSSANSIIFAQNFLTLERLIKVVFLLPRSL